MTRPGKERRKVFRIPGSSVPEREPLTESELHHYAQWPQRLRNNYGRRDVPPEELSVFLQVIPVIEHLVSEIRRLKGH